MSNAYRDENDVPTLIASSSVDEQTPVRVFADPVTHRLLVDLAGGGTVDSVVGTADRITVDSTDPANPIVNIALTYVGQNTITTLGTITTGVWNGTLLAGQYGGTGVANTGKTITVSGNVAIGSNTDTVAFVTAGNTSVTLPTSGTLATTTQVATKANVALDNLASVAINTTLVSDTDNTDDLGTSSVFWRTGYFKTSLELGATDTTITRSAAGIIAVEGVDQVNLSASQTLTNKTLTSPTVTTATLSGAQQLAEGASIALDPSLSADGTYSGATIAGTAGTTLAFGDLIYFAVADSRWELVDADSVTTAGAVLAGFCVLAAASDGDPTVILLDGNIRADTAFPVLTVGAPVYAGTSPGDIQVAQPSGTDDVIHVVGFALTADSILVKISPDYITHI